MSESGGGQREREEGGGGADFESQANLHYQRVRKQNAPHRLSFATRGGPPQRTQSIETQELTRPVGSGDYIL